MTGIDTALVIWVGAFFSAILGAFIPAFISARQAEKARVEQREADRRREQIDALLELLRQLVETRAQLQFFQAIPVPKTLQLREDATLRELFEKQQTLYGKAYALMLCIPDAKVRTTAKEIMKESGTREQKHESIDNAIEHLAERLESKLK